MFLLIIWTNFWVAGCGNTDWHVRVTSTEILFLLSDERILRKDHNDLEIAHRMEIILDRRQKIKEKIEEMMGPVTFKYDRMKKFMEIEELGIETPWFKSRTKVPTLKLLFILCKFTLEDFGVESYLYEMRFGVPVITFPAFD